MRPNLAAALWALLLVGSTVAPAASETSRIDAVTSDPHYDAWLQTLRESDRSEPPSAPAPDAAAPQTCGASDALQPLALRRHRARQRLLESLRARGVRPGPPEEPVGAWPWGPGIDGIPGGPALVQSETGNTAVLVDDGTIVFTNINGAPEVDPILAARAFYEIYDDEYDFMLLFTNFYSELFAGRFLAYHITVSNDVEGIGFKHWYEGQEHVDIGPEFTQNETQPTRLKSFIHLNWAALYPDDPGDPFCPFGACRQYPYPALIGHEIGHRWGARILLCPGQHGDLTALLGDGNVHWSFFLNSDASVLEGNRWEGDEATGFTTTEISSRYSKLDLYLMGMIPLSDVPESELFFLADANNFDPEFDGNGFLFSERSPPQVGVSCNAAKINFTRDCIQIVNGVRRPAYPNTPSEFRAVTVLVTSPGSPVTSGDLDKLETIRAAAADWFHTHTQERGSLDFTVRRVPAEVLFAHHPQGDVEDPSQPIEIRAGVELRQRSLPTTLDDVRFTLHYSVDGGAFSEVAMTRVRTTDADEVFASIPPQAEDSEVRYYIRSSTDLSEHEYTAPRGAPESTHLFSVRPDTQPPRITHVPVELHARSAEPAILRAVVLDDHGVDDVQVEYRVRGGDTQTLALAAQGESDVYEARLSPPGRIGDTVEYRIVATDVARTPHVAALPASGWFEMNLTRIQFEDVEVEDPLWTHRSLKENGIDEWHRQPFHNATPIGNYSWKAGPDNLLTNPRLGQTAYEQDAVLEGPAVRLGEGWELRFRHRYYLRAAPPPPDADPSAIDGGVLQWQDVEKEADVARDKWFLIDPVDGYTHQFGTWALFNPLQWWPCWSGDQDFFDLERVDASSTNHDFRGRMIRFRFRLATSVSVERTTARAGWYIDDIEIDPGLPVAVTLEELRAERLDVGVELAWRAHDLEDGDLFHIDRADVDAGGEPVLFTHRVTIAAEPHVEEYAWTDSGARAGSYAYRVRLVSNGVERITRQVIVAGAAPRFVLHANRPNPFNPSTQIAFELPADQHARLDIYDVSGRHVATLVDEPLHAGPHRTDWDGTDRDGRAVASGVYLYRLQSGTRTTTRRMMLLR